jgi:hypothetical protein
MVATRAIKRAVIDSSNPLQHEGLREHIFSFVGAGHWWFVAQVSRAWMMSYSRIKELKMTGLDVHGGAVRFACKANVTLTQAAFASAACYSLATDSNVNGALRVDNSGWRLQQYGGQFSDLNTLRLALERGLPASARTIQGAAKSGSLDKVRWLHEVQKTPLPFSIGEWAAEGGNLELLTWLTEHGCKFTLYSCVVAAAAGHKHVLRYLQERDCEWDERSTAAGAEKGYLSLVKWMISAGCPFDAAGLCRGAARSGSIEMMVYARQQLGCELNARVMQAAAERGRLSMCQYLRSEECPWDSSAPESAAFYGCIDTLRWLREQGCPWTAADVCGSAAEGGHIDVMQYLVPDPALATPELLQEMLQAAGSQQKLAAVQWSRQQGAEWPDVLQYDGMYWSGDCLAWARQQGCAAPTDIDDL